MKVWLDDRRPPPPDSTWTWVKLPEDAIKLLETEEVEVISFDHDLGIIDGEELTGYTVVLWIEEAVALRGYTPPEMRVHSANPPGHERLLRGVRSIEERVERRGASSGGDEQQGDEDR